MKHINVPMPEDVHKRLRIYCAEIDSNMAETIRRIVTEYLHQRGPNIQVAPDVYARLISEGKIKKGSTAVEVLKDKKKPKK